MGLEPQLSVRPKNYNLMDSIVSRTHKRKPPHGHEPVAQLKTVSLRSLQSARASKLRILGVVGPLAIAATLVICWPAPKPTAMADARDDRDIPRNPWPAETAQELPAFSGLQLMSPGVLDDARRDVGATVDDNRVIETSAAASLRIDGTSDEAMVQSINDITGLLPEEDARAFQKAVRILMVSSLPIDRMRSQHVLPENIDQTQLIAGGRQALAGKTVLQVLQAAQARIDDYKAKATGGAPIPVS